MLDTVPASTRTAGSTPAGVASRISTTAPRGPPPHVSANSRTKSSARHDPGHIFLSLSPSITFRLRSSLPTALSARNGGLAVASAEPLSRGA